MNTYQYLNDGKITGDVCETYCKKCDEIINVYTIRKIKEDIDNPHKKVMEGIENYIARQGRKLEKLKDIKKRHYYIITKKQNYYEVKIPEYEDYIYSSKNSPEMTVKEIIKKALSILPKEIDSSIERQEKTYNKYLNSNYLVINDSKRLNDFDDTITEVNCPICDSKIDKNIIGNIACPRCRYEICFTTSKLMD